MTQVFRQARASSSTRDAIFICLPAVCWKRPARIFPMPYRPLLILILSAFAVGCAFAETILVAPAAKLAEVPVSAAKPGPWGQLESSPIYLEAPDFLLAGVPKPNSVPHWSFVGMDATALRALFKDRKSVV